MYNLKITENAEALLDNLVSHLLYNIKSEQAAKHLLYEIEKIYERLEQNPFQFPVSQDFYLKQKEYRVATIPGMNYVIIFSVIDTVIYIVGFFHDSEQYIQKTIRLID